MREEERRERERGRANDGKWDGGGREKGREEGSEEGRERERERRGGQTTKEGEGEVSEVVVSEAGTETAAKKWRGLINIHNLDCTTA